MQILNKRVKKRYEDYIRSMYPMIQVQPGVCRYNFHCHRNAVHDAVSERHEKLAMTVYIDGGIPIIHFISVADGRYVDNTLGQWSTRYDFYLIREVSRDEFWSIDAIFDGFRAYLRGRLTWWERLLSDFEA